ncbi:MAG: hypothetical protein JSS30_05245 [Verrucomicrobia bacterium]|nr:hypothetical protein [Verrucomicrobiota bacterium]
MTVERPIYLSELFIFLRKKKKLIFKVAAASFLVTFLAIFLFAKPQFRADATFRQARTSSEEAGSLQTLLLNIRLAPEETSAMAIMHSRRLLGRVIDKTALQIISDAHCKNVHYEREIPLTLILEPTSSTTFEILNQQQDKLARGSLNKPILLDYCHLTVTQMPAKTTTIKLLPKRKALKQLTKKLKIKGTRLDPNLLQLTYRHPERETAINVLNTLMEEFQHHLESEHEQLALQQLDYLQKRKEQLGSDFHQALDEHTTYLQKEGALNLAQALETLTEPKEQYTAKQQQLDLELKKWKDPQLTASLDLPPTFTEFTGLTLETAERLHQNYAQEHEQQITQIASLQTFSDKIDQCQLSTLSQILTDEVSQKIIQQATQLSLQLADEANYSEKELHRLRDALSTQKKFLQEHILKKIDLLHTQLALTQQKMNHLKHVALDLIKKEKSLIEEKLGEINTKMETLPQKWRLENELKFKKELMMQIIEGVTKLSESKVVNHHLFHIASKPLDLADAPPTPQPTHPFLYSTIASLLSSFFFILFSFLQAVLRGLPISPDYLRDHKIPIVTDLLRLYYEPHTTIALIGLGSGKALASHLAHQGRRILRVVYGLEEQLHPSEDHHLAVVRDLQLAKLSTWKRDYDHILLEIDNLDTIAPCMADQFIIKLNETKPEELTPFENKKLYCIFSV